jgi:hypothetical protein
MDQDRTDKTDNNSIKLSEWGIPDWRDKTAYGDVASWTTNQWRWEFYRRRTDLRDFYDRWAPTVFQEGIRCNEGLSPDQPGFTVTGRGEDAGIAIKKYGYAGVPNPRIAVQRDIVIMPIDQLTNRLRYLNPAQLIPDEILPSSSGEKHNEVTLYKIRLRPHDYAIKFDLNKPLNFQLKEAGEILKKNQKKLKGKKLQSRMNERNWLGYLRALDGREVGATWADLASVFFDDGTLDRRSAPGGGYQAPPPQAARDLWLAGDALRSDF